MTILGPKDARLAQRVHHIVIPARSLATAVVPDEAHNIRGAFACRDVEWAGWVAGGFAHQAVLGVLVQRGIIMVQKEDELGCAPGGVVERLLKLFGGVWPATAGTQEFDQRFRSVARLLSWRYSYFDGALPLRLEARSMARSPAVIALRSLPYSVSSPW